MSDSTPVPPVRPGAGVATERLPMASVRADLRGGTFVLDTNVGQELADMKAYVQEAGPDAVDKAQIGTLLYADEAKTFRNAFASLVIEEAWPGYSEAVAGDRPGVFSLAVDGDTTLLVPVPADTLSTMPQTEVADRIALSNQATLSHFICQQFFRGRTPIISGQADADAYYAGALQDQAVLMSILDSEFRILPLSVGASAVFVASGAVVLRTQVFGVPNLMDRFSVRDNLQLTNSQHRQGFDNTMRRSVMPFYLPITNISVGIDRQVVDPVTMALQLESWRHNNDPADFFVYPDPAIVSSVNKNVQSRKEAGERLAGNQTGCPAFHSKVSKSPEEVSVVPLPRSLAELGLSQLDRWYYPNRLPV